MPTSRHQRTIASAVAVSGFGFFHGRDVRLEFHPAAADHGIVFVRCDRGRSARIPAAVAHRVESPRRTSLEAHGVRVEMIEHVMAALAGLGIDNCEVRVDQAEMPGLDGSAQPFVDALTRAGHVDLPVPRRRIVVRDVLRVGGQDCWIEARPATGERLDLEYHLDYGEAGPVGRQTFSLAVTPTSFRDELAPSRTFLLKEEAEGLLAMGLGKRVSPRDVLVFDTAGPVANRLRFADECARHKTLDLVGDLALSGCAVTASIIACRSGHRLNAELTRAMLAREADCSARRRSA